MTTKGTIYTLKEVSLLIKCSESAIIKAIATSKKNGRKSIKVKNNIYYFYTTENTKGYIFSKTEFVLNTDVNIDLKIDIDTEIEDLNLNITVNGMKVK